MKFNRVLLCGLLPLSLMACQTTGENSVSVENRKSEVTEAGNELTAYEVIASHQWQLKTIGGKSAPMGFLEKPLMIMFDNSKHTVSGFAGCNNFFGQFTATDFEMVFGQLAMSRKFCQAEADVETLFMAMLGQVAHYQINGKVLTLSSSNQDVLAVFEQQ